MRKTELLLVDYKIKLLKKRILRWVGIILAIVVLLLLGIWLALQNSSIQGKIARYLTDNLSNDLNTTISIDKVDIDFIKTIDIQGFYVEDLKGDTLIYANHLYGNIGIFSLFNKKIFLDEIKLEDAYVNLYEQDSIPNYQFLIDHFTGGEPNPDSQPWIFSMSEVDVADTKISFDTETRDINAFIKRLETKFTEFDLDKSVATLSEINLNESSVEIITSDSTITSADEESLSLDSLSFPILPWKVKIEDFLIDDFNLSMKEKGYQSESNAIDTKDLEAHIEELAVSDIELGPTYSLSLNNLRVKERSGIIIEDTSLEFLFDEEGIVLDNLELNTNDSHLEGDVRVVYDQFDSFVKNPNGALVELNIQPSYIGGSSIMRLRNIVDLSNLNIKANDKITLQGKLTKDGPTYTANQIVAQLNDEFYLNGDATFSQRDPINGSSITFNINELSTSAQKLKKKFPELQIPQEVYNLGKIKAIIKGEGQVDNLHIDTLSLITETSTHLHGSGYVKGLPDMNTISYDLNISSLRADPRDILNDSLLTDQIIALGELSYIGSITGNLNQIDIDGNLSTDIGALESDMAITIPKDDQILKYAGDIRLNQFDLGVFLQDSTYGVTTVRATVDGQGASIDELHADIDAEIEEAYYNGKIYEGAVIKGAVDGMSYDGIINIDDENISLNYDGIIDLSESTPKFVFEMQLDTLNLQSFNLSDQDIRLSGFLRSELVGDNYDDVQGEVIISDLYVYKEDNIYAPGEDIVLKIENLENDNKEVNLDSPILDFSAEGYILPTEIVQTMKTFVNNYFPVDVIDTTYNEIAQVNEENAVRQTFDVSLQTKDINPVLNFFVADNTYLKNLTVDATFDSYAPNLEFEGKVDSLAYQDFMVSKSNITVEGKKEHLKFNIYAEDILNGDEVMIPIVDIVSTTSDNIINLSIDLKDDDNLPRFNIGSAITRVQDELRLSLHDSIIINREEWHVDENNITSLRHNNLHINDLDISRENQSIEVYTTDDNGVIDINARFTEFSIDEITKIIGKEEDYLTGRINGDITFNDYKDQQFLTTDLVIDSIAYENEPVGRLSLNAEQNRAKNTIEGSFDLIGENNDALGSMSYNIESEEMDGFLEVAKMEMRLIDPFLSELIEDSEGNLYGDFQIGGTPDRPDISGNLLFDNASTVIVLSQTRYKIKEQRITFDNKLIEMGKITLYDEYDQQATISGEIRHNSFEDMYLNLSAETQGFQVLNTTSEDNNLFYGNIFIDATLTIVGPPDDLKLDAVGKAVNNSNLVLSPFSSADEIVKDEYIIFANPEELKNDTISRVFHITRDEFPVDVNMQIEVESDSEFQFIVDPITGDKLVAYGNADLNIQMKKNGDLFLYGPYTATSGSYVFSYGFIEKRFDIEPGGTVSFSGDPLLAKLDIDAIYTTYTDIYDLIKSEVNVNEIGSARKKTDVNVVLNISGEMLKPNISLNITLPTDDQNEIIETARIKLEALRSNTNELNNQVFGLLLFDSFITTDNTIGGGINSATENIVLGSVSSLITNQLNNLASNLIKGVDVSFDVNNYSNEYAADGGLVTELGVGVSKNLLDDRMTLKAGGNFNIESNSDQAEFTSLVGDFILEYKLNEKGNYVLRVFNKTNFDRLIDENNNKTGVSIFIKKNLD